MKKISIFTMLLFAPLQIANATEVSFDDAWNTIYKNSHLVKSAEFDKDAAHMARTRSALNWLPKVYVAGSGFQTNDPAMVFMGNLKQEQVSVTDFNPDILNSPTKADFYTGSVGVELPLFEGGRKYREYTANGHYLKSAKFNEKQTKNMLYAQVLQQYGSLIVLAQEKEQLQEVQRIIDNVSKNYQLNRAQNPMGKSGAMGLKSLSNRLDIMLMENAEREKSIRELMAMQGIKDTDWQPTNISITDLLSEKVKLDLKSESFGLQSGDEHAQGMRQSAFAAGAAHLPYVSAFAQNDIFNGDRGTGHSYTVGLSFKWSLYDPSTMGIEREAKLRAAAQQEKVAVMRENESAARNSLLSSLEASKKSVDLMKESYELLVNQTTQTNKMFKNGVINVLQWLEVLSRRTDVIQNLRDSELNLLQQNVYSITQSKFEI